MTIDELIDLMATDAPSVVGAYLSNNPIDLNQGNANGGFCPLTAAIELGNSELVEVLLDHGADPDYHADHDSPPLCGAIECAVDDWDVSPPYQGVPALDMIRLLVERGADPHRAWTQDGSTPIDWARGYGFDQAVSYFERLDWQRSIQNGAAVDIEGMIWLGRTAEAQAIVEVDEPDLNQPGSSGRTPLETAIEQADGDMIEFLVAHGADPNLVGQSGMTPLAAAIRFSLEHWDYVDHREGQPSTATIEKLVRLGADPTLPASRGTRYEKLNEPARLFLAQFDND